MNEYRLYVPEERDMALALQQLNTIKLAFDSIIAKLTAAGEEFSGQQWVGQNYSKADLLKDLRNAKSGRNIDW